MNASPSKILSSAAKSIDIQYNHDPLDYCIWADRNTKALGKEAVEKLATVEEFEEVANSFSWRLKRVFLKSARDSIAESAIENSATLAANLDSQIEAIPTHSINVNGKDMTSEQFRNLSPELYQQLMSPNRY